MVYLQVSCERIATRDPLYRIDRLYGMDLSRRAKEQESDRFNILINSIEQKPVILTNPDIFHLITHFRDPGKKAVANLSIPIAGLKQQFYCSSRTTGARSRCLAS